MAQYRPFAVWDGTSTIPSGTSQSQNILIGVADQNYNNLGGFDWWAGPDESLGYIIAYYDGTFSHPNQLNIPCGIGFLRSDSLTDISFLDLFNHLMANLSLAPISNVNDAKTWLLANGYWTSYGEAAWTYSNPVTPTTPSGPSTGAGEWFFYSTSGTLDVGPPTSAGNFIITEYGVAGGTLESYDPNFDGSSQKMIHLNVSDSTNDSFLTEFNNLAQNGGTITITQNGQSATYTSPQPGVFFINSNQFLSFPVNIQTASTDGPFTYSDPVSVSFGSPTGTKHYWTAGDPSQQGQFAMSANNSNQLELATNLYVSKFAKDSAGNNITDISAFLAAISNGDTIVLKSTTTPSNTATYTVNAVTLFGSGGYNLNVSHVSGTGYVHLTLWEIDFI